jgi:hypothetical protein
VIEVQTLSAPPYASPKAGHYHGSAFHFAHFDFVPYL